MTYREVGGSLVWQGTVSGTDQTAVSLYEPTHAVRVFLENPGSPAVNIFAGEDFTVINSTASGVITITGAGNVDVITEGSTLTISGTGASDHGNLLGLLDDDHPQYLLVDGSRPMSGPLDLAGANVENVGLVSAISGSFSVGVTSLTGTYSESLTISGVPVATAIDVDNLSNQIANAGATVQSLLFTEEVSVVFAHGFGTSHYFTTVLDSTGLLIEGEVVQANNSVTVTFTESQSGTVLVMRAGLLVSQQSFTEVTQVILNHGFGTLNYLTTILDPTGLVIAGDIVQSLSSVQIDFNEPQSGIVISMGVLA